ncbi:response regulator [Streptomyces sp. NRRL F-2664]|uniref:response regulator n=1 Tax=Streptomyces sp. NRRL F-2664 TaxID=1463842 RepID=UPI0009987AA0|nr:response regulator transcription factor [Streptomyces sp. NRRL F-2664]
MTSHDSGNIRVIIADDHPVYRDGVSKELASAPNIDIIATCSNGDEALKAILEHHPDVAILDYKMPMLNGGQVAMAAAEKAAPTKVVILSAFTEDAAVYQALRDGASGYLTKESDSADILDAVMTCLRGEVVLPNRLAAGLISEIRSRAETHRPNLTDREVQILQMLSSGLSTPAIAKGIFLAPSTVKTHLQHICDKLGVSGRAAAVAEAMRRGILS